MTSLRVLIIEDSENDVLLITDYLRRGGFDLQSRVVDDLSDLEAALAEEWDVIISDYMLPDFTALDALGITQKMAPDTPLLVVSGRVGEDVAVDAMKAGASDFVIKSKLVRLAPAVERELREAQVRRDRRLARTALAESEERYRTLFEYSNDGIIVIQDGMIQLANERFSQISGYSNEELLNVPFTNFLPPDEAAILYDNYKRRIAGEDIPSIYEIAMTRKGGIKLDFEISANIVNYNGKPADIVICRDVTERKRTLEKLDAERQHLQAALKALGESEEHYRMLFDTIDEGFCIIEVIFDENEKPIDYRFLEINPAFERQTGLIDARGKRMRELVPKLEEYWFETFGKIALTGQPVRFQNRAEQLHRWYDIYAFRFGQPEDRQVAILFNDITERKAFQEELENARDRAEQAAQSEAEVRATLQAIFDASPVGLVTIDAATKKITYSNAAAAGILGGALAGLGGLPEPESYQLLRLDGTTYPADESPLSRAIVHGRQCLNEQMLVRRHDGSEVIVYVTCASILDEERKIAGAVVTLDDVTEMVELQKEIEEALERERQFSLLLQRALLPTEPYIGPEYDVAAEYAPMFASREIGGDFFDVFRVGDCRSGILIGDVSGKGLEAAAMAATTRSTIHAFVHETASAAEALARANTVLYSRQGDFDSFATVFLIIIDLCAGGITYSSAGHPPPVICRYDGTVEFLRYGQMPLAVMDTQLFEDHRISFEPGDKIVLYTDGISEARRNGDFLDLNGIERVVTEHANLDASGVARVLLSSATDWANGKLRDDAAVVVVESKR